MLLMCKVLTIKLRQNVMSFSFNAHYKYDLLWNYGIGQW